MTHLTDILKWPHRREITTTTGAATRETSCLTEINGQSLHPDSWPGTFINPRDGSTMCLVPGGKFFMGSTRQDTESARNMDADGEHFDLTPEMPQFDLFVPSFYISVFAVTNEQFARFLSERQPSSALFDLWVYTVAHVAKPDRQNERYRVEPGFERHPAIHVTWFGADAYCRWAKLRLPTEIEWEKAARGTDARLFPWGNNWHDGFVRSHRRERGEPTALVDEYPQGRSPYGVFQMAGNVAEWCEDWYQPNAYTDHALGNRRPPPSGDERVLRGGTCVQQHKLEFRCAMRQSSTPVFLTVDFTGIRCACDLPVIGSPNGRI